MISAVTQVKGPQRSGGGQEDSDDGRRCHWEQWVTAATLPAQLLCGALALEMREPSE